MKILKHFTGQTKQVLLKSDNTVDVLDYNDATGRFELKYSMPSADASEAEEEYEMQLFFNFK